LGHEKKKKGSKMTVLLAPNCCSPGAWGGGGATWGKRFLLYDDWKKRLSSRAVLKPGTGVNKGRGKKKRGLPNTVKRKKNTFLTRFKGQKT